MHSSKKLVTMAKKWQKISILGRRRVTFERKVFHSDSEQCNSPRAKKGHFVVYSIDGKQFMIPLDYLNTRIVMQLFHLSEEEFGYTADGPITLPCEAAFIEYVMDLVMRGVSEEVERALLDSILLPCHHGQSHLRSFSQQVEV